MSEIALIWAQARNSAGRGVIGAHGSIPWHVPEDFTHFKQLTSGHPVVMGERTWISLPNKPLPNRTNIVLSDRVSAADAEQSAEQQPKYAANLDQAFSIGAQAPGGELTWVMGGESVYRQTIGLAQRLAVTEIDLVVEGDTFAPEIPQARFPVASIGNWLVSRNGIRYRFIEYSQN